MRPQDRIRQLEARIRQLERQLSSEGEFATQDGSTWRHVWRDKCQDIMWRVRLAALENDTGAAAEAVGECDNEAETRWVWNNLTTKQKAFLRHAEHVMRMAAGLV